jgi:outer membrane protein assembly factor BamB
MRLTAALFAATVAALTAAETTADWPRFRGPNGDGISPLTGINKDWKARPPKEQWRIPMGDSGSAGMSVADGLVYIVDHQGGEDVVRALKLADGTEAWRFAYADTEKANYGFSRSTPTVDGGRIFTWSRMGTAYCLDAKTGAKVWAFDAKAEIGARRPTWNFANSVLIDGGTAIICPGSEQGLIAALDKATGKLLWKGGGAAKAGYATPVPFGQGAAKQYLVAADESLVGIDATSGKQLWTFPWKTKYGVNAASPLPTDAGVLITSNYGWGCAMLQIGSGGAQQVWAGKIITSHMTTPVFIGGHLYGTSDPGVMVCVDPRTGKEVWKAKGWGKGGLVAVDGCIIVQDVNSGDIGLVAIDPSAYRELGRIKAFPKVDNCWTSPVVAQGRFLARSHSELVCYDLK